MQPRNPFLCLTIVWFLGLLAVLSLLGIIALGIMGKEPPGALISIASGSMCSLASFLVAPPRYSAGFDEQATAPDPPHPPPLPPRPPAPPRPAAAPTGPAKPKEEQRQ